MEKTVSTSNYDVIVIRHKNDTYKSTPFQAVFAEKTIKLRQSSKAKLKQVQLFVNDELVELPLRIDPSNGRVQFQKKYIKKIGNNSDSSDVSEDQLSQRSASRQKRLSTGLKESVDELKNEQAPKAFWQFHWLFNKRNEPVVPITKPPQQDQNSEQPKLAKIKEQPYEGEESSKQPLFQFSLCGHLLAKKRQKQASKEELERMFYANKIEYKDFIKDPFTIMSDTNLVVRIDNGLYAWQLGATILACKYAFGIQPQNELIDRIIKAKTKKRWLPIFGSNNMTKLDIEKQPPQIQSSIRIHQQEIIKYRKAPDSEMISKMKLKMGQNTAKFVLEVGNNGVIQQTKFKIFLWDQNEKIVISDIDGTITRSDVMGQVKTNYIHKGVCLLYNQIYKRNYKLLYMTARAIGQYKQTSTFLEKQVEQNGMKLPPGPLLMSPDGYLKSFTRQVLQKNPDQLKIKLLASINQIFPNNKKPIVAGFGNRQTDSIAYLRIKIPPERIFCISEKSVITNEDDKQFSTTYPDMLEHIEDYFPYYSKAQFSQPSSKEQIRAVDQNEEQALVNKRKLSHSQFYDRLNESDNKNSQSLSASKTRSEDGGDSYENIDYQMLIQQFTTIKSKQQ